MAYIFVSSRCNECIWLNCCDWIGRRDQSKCQNHLGKEKYLAKLNGEKYEEPEPEPEQLKPISKLDVLDALERLNELYGDLRDELENVQQLL